MAEDTKASAEAFAEIHIPNKQGVVKYEHLKMIASKGKHVPLFDQAEPPEEASFVFRLYWEKFMGTGLTYTELKAYEDVEGIKLYSWEVDLLFMIHNTVEGYKAKVYK